MKFLFGWFLVLFYLVRDVDRVTSPDMSVAVLVDAPVVTPEPLPPTTPPPPPPDPELTPIQVETVRVLNDAWKLLSKGWAKGTMEVEGSGRFSNRRYCLVGAIRAAGNALGILGNEHSMLYAYKALATSLGSAYTRFDGYYDSDNDYSGALMAWNDYESRTHHEVLDLVSNTIRNIETGKIPA